MSITRIVEIQRHIQLDDKTMSIMRHFDLDWSCGTRFMIGLINSGIKPAPLGAALNEVLHLYKSLSERGVSDYERLYFVLSETLTRVARTEKNLTVDLVEGVCQSALVPSTVREYLVNG